MMTSDIATLADIEYALDRPISDQIREHKAKQASYLSRQDIRDRVRSALQRGLPQFTACVSTAKTWAIVGGGPSIADTLPALRRLKRQGVPIISLNKSHDWLLSKGIVPWGHVVMDGHEWVADYIRSPRRDVRYFVASQCHPNTFDALTGFPAFLWHGGQDSYDQEGDLEWSEPADFIREHCTGDPVIIGGGTTVGTRAPRLGHILGVDHFHLFGYDSSRCDGKLHPYEKTEYADPNHNTVGLKVRGATYWFNTNAHMAKQYQDFDQLVANLPDFYARGVVRKEFGLTVHGAGLLPTWAAGLGYHADARCNADPALVGGWEDSDMPRVIPMPQVFYDMSESDIVIGMDADGF